MNFGAELSAYERKRTLEKSKKNEQMPIIIKITLYMLSCFLITRNIAFDSLAPFGLALYPVFFVKDKKIAFLSYLAITISYFTLKNTLTLEYLYITVCSTVYLLSISKFKMRVRERNVVVIVITSLEYLLYNVFVSLNGIKSETDLKNYLITILIIAFSGYICSGEKFDFLVGKINTFSYREILLVTFITSFVISGTKGIVFNDVNLINILALLFIIFVSYALGTNYGILSGVIMSIAYSFINIQVNELYKIYIFLTLLGFIVSFVKNKNKFYVPIAVVGFVFLSKYTLVLVNPFSYVEELISICLFLLIPRKIYEKLKTDSILDSNTDISRERHLNFLKSIITSKIDKFSDVLTEMSSTINGFVKEEKELDSSRNVVLLENLSDRVCSKCSLKQTCWRKEIHYTYASFGVLIDSYIRGTKEFPEDLNYRCIRKEILKQNTEEMVKNYLTEQMWKKRIYENKKTLSSQMSNMASSMNELTKEFDTNIGFNSEIDQRLSEKLSKSKIIVKDIFTFTEKNNRLFVNIYVKDDIFKKDLKKQITSIVNSVVPKKMHLVNTELTATENITIFEYEEMPKFKINIYSAFECKYGEKYNGDSFIETKLKNNNHLIALCDGMGSGAEAVLESKKTVDLIENFVDAGFSNGTAINTVNTIMGMRFSDEEKFSTLDLASIDLYTGITTFYKVGAVSTFIKKANKLDVIKSKTLPMGVLDTVDVDIEKNSLKDGDIIIMLSDGVMDACREKESKNKWIEKFISVYDSSNYKLFCEELIRVAKSFNDGKANDDMTVIVAEFREENKFA